MATIVICDMCKQVISSGMKKYRLTSSIDNQSTATKKKIETYNYTLTLCENCSKRVKNYIDTNTKVLLNGKLV